MFTQRNTSNAFLSLMGLWTLTDLRRWSTTGGSPACITRPVATFVNYVYTVKIIQ